MQAKTISLPQYKHIFVALAALSVLSAIFYMYAVNQTVRNVVMRQKMQNELSILTSHIGEMEFHHISQKNAIDLNKAYALGFEDTKANIFVARETSVAFAGRTSITR